MTTCSTVDDIQEAITALKNNNAEYVRYKNGNGYPSIKLKTYKRFDGSEEIIINEVGDGSIIKLFDKTPYPISNDDVVCPHFMELKWANGCNFDCAWCYLNGTFRFRPIGKNPYKKDIDKIEKHLRGYFSYENDLGVQLPQLSYPTLFNSGELADSLIFEGNGFALSKFIIPLFLKQDLHKLLILTKSTNIKGILASNSQNCVIVSFSINAEEVAKRWEKKSPLPVQRIEAAGKLFNLGYKTRIRLDPIVPITDWEHEYKLIIDKIFENLVPERITMGSLRGLQSTINFSKDTSWTEYLDGKSNWGRKVSFDKRYEIFNSLIKYLEDEYDFFEIGLCKETVGMWEKLGMDYKEIKCNCIL